jgi:hypothetical protein
VSANRYLLELLVDVGVSLISTNFLFWDKFRLFMVDFKFELISLKESSFKYSD